MSRREVSHRDRDRGDRDRDDYPSKRQAAPRESTSSRPKLDEFWLDGEGIDRQVLQSSICRFLGSEATSRPFELNVCPYAFRGVVLGRDSQLLGKARLQDQSYPSFHTCTVQ